MASEHRPEAAAAAPEPPAVQSLSGELQLVAAVLRRDRKATAQFVSDYADAVYAYVRHRLTRHADLVEDLVQDVFVAALGSLPGYRGTSSLQSWLLGIARHKVEDYYRAQLRRPEVLLDDDGIAEPVAEDAPLDLVLDRARVQAKAHQVLQDLPEPYALALLWRYWEGRSVREMAAALGKTEKAVERLLARARARFKDIWEQRRP
jgi:RNA polymerase sigma-70 factor (ECF subfamily)